MATMTFLANFNGNLNYQDSAGTGTLVPTGTVTYQSSPYFTGKQGVIVDLGNGVTSPAANTAAKISPANGAVAVRFRRDTDAGAVQYLMSAGGVSTAQGLLFRINDADILEVVHYNGANSTLPVGTAIGTGANMFGYTDWTGTAISVRRDGVTATGTRGAASASFGAVNMGYGVYGTVSNHIRGLVDCIAIFDGPLTTTEQTFLQTTQAPWSWGMTLSNPAPVVNAGPDGGATTTTTWTQAGSFTDTSSSVSWTATVDYGDGGGAGALTLNPDKTFSLSHAYTATGTYTVTVRVTDDQGATGTDTVAVTVTAGPITGRFLVLGVAGTDASAPVITL